MEQKKTKDTENSIKQLLLVLGDTDTSITAIMQRYELGKTGMFVKVGSPIPVTVGRTGFSGCEADTDSSFVLNKKEGDGKTPSGIYPLGKVYGYGPKPSWMQMPYIVSTPEIICVDDSKSAHYNMIISSSNVDEKDWDSHEDMLRKDGQYKFCVEVHYNCCQAVKGDGSCIFMHIWKGPGLPTAGCTAMAETDLVEVLKWVNPDSNPVLATFDNATFEKVKKKNKVLVKLN